MSGPATDAKPSPSGSDPRPAAICRRRRGWRWLVAGALVPGVFLARGPQLRGLAGLLTAEGPDRAVAGVVLVRGDRIHDAAAARVRDGAAEVLLIERVPLRYEALGVIPVRTEIDRRALEARGVPAPAIHVLSEQTHDDWDGARVLNGWLRDHPGAHVAVLCDRFGSRRQRIILDRVLVPDAARAHVVALPDRRYDETNWWRSKDGLASWWEGFVGLSYVSLAGEGEKP
jgi:hypothetical protein